MTDKKILLIGYGGTITMVTKGNKIVPAKNIDELLLSVPGIKKYKGLQLEILSDIDSTNITPNDWTRMAYFIYDNYEAYDAFIITHGTNTMAYTASALALALGKGLGKPVILTGSQLPLTAYGNDARFNLENSLKVAIEMSDKGLGEVVLVFDDMILKGARCLKISESSFRAFDSPNYPLLGNIRSTGIILNKSSFKNIEGKFEITPHFQTGILTVDLTPGQSPSLIEIVLKSGKCKGVILKSHGAGSVPTSDEFSFLPLIKKATSDYKIPVLVTTKFLGGNAFKEINDEPAVEAIENGAIPTGDLTDVMSEVKLMWLLAQGKTNISELRKLIIENFVGEVNQAY